MASLRRDPRGYETASLGRQLRGIRRAVGWTQLDVARRTGVSQTWVSAVERGRVSRLRLDTVHRLLGAMGARLNLTVDAPYLADRRLQRDAGHARCIAYVVGRLRRAGWQVATEVEVGGDRSRGWIDILAQHPTSHVVLVIEVKTELHDIGQIERTLGWYQREAWAAARRLDWRPAVPLGVLMFLETATVDERSRPTERPSGSAFPDARPSSPACSPAGSPPTAIGMWRCSIPDRGGRRGSDR